MVWVIAGLLFLILLVVAGARGILGFIYLIGCLLVMYLALAVMTRDSDKTNEYFLWLLGIGVTLAVIKAIHEAFSDPEEKTCPYCDEEIKFKAVVCKHCGRDQPATQKRTPSLPLRERLAMTFRIPDTTDWTLKDYAKVSALTFVVCLASFSVLFALFPPK